MKRLFISLIVLSLCAPCLEAQTSYVKKTVLQGFWWDYWNNNYPNGWANYIADLAPRLKSMGVDAIWVPPSVKNDGQIVGYAPFDHYDLGDKYQKGNTATRLGTKDELLRMVAVLHANGIEVIQDVVPNHITGAGSNNGSGGQDPAAPAVACTNDFKNFRYSSYVTPATDQSATDYFTRTGRFPKNHQNFHPNPGHTCSSLCDPNGDAWCWQAFGPDICYYDGALGSSSNATYNPDQSTYSPNNNGGTGANNGYMRKNTREWLIWYKKQMGFDGLRIDAVKNFPYWAAEDFLFTLQHSAGFASGTDAMFSVGEYVGSTGLLDGWVGNVADRSGTFDFNLRAFDATGGLHGMVTGLGAHDMGTLSGAQQAKRYIDIGGVRIYRTVPFVNLHDTFRPLLDANGNYTGFDLTNQLSPEVNPREPRLAAAYAVAFAVDGNPSVFFEDLLNINNTSKRWTHLPTNTSDLPENSDLVNLMKCSKALDFKSGAYTVPSNSVNFWNVIANANNNDDIMVVERTGKAIIAATDSWNVDQECWMDTGFPVGTVLQDYSGGIATTTTVQCPSGGCGSGGPNRVNIKVRACGYPSFLYTTTYADHGAHYHGYAVWAPVGIDINAPSNAAIPTVQEWEMDNDLGDSHCTSLGQGGRTPDNSPNARVAGKIFPAGGSTVNYSMTIANAGNSLTLEFYDLNGALVHSTSGAANPVTGSFVNASARWLTIKVRNTAANTPGQRCWIKTTYHGPATAATASNPSATAVSIWTSNGGSSSWTDCRNWEEGRVPTCTSTVVLPHPTAFMPTVDPCFTGDFVLGYCIAPTVFDPSVTQPSNCSNPLGSISVEASISYGGSLEYSVDGSNWQSSSTFNSLAPGSYNVQVRRQGMPTCIANYASNPVVVNSAGCCPTYTNACSNGNFVQDFSMSSYSNLGTGCGSPGANYSSYLPAGPNVQAGETYAVTLRAGTSDQHFAVYIDLNGNGSYTDAGEFFPIGQAMAGQTVTANVTIPANLAIGTRILRVRSAAQALLAADGCATTQASGETEDYNLFVFCPNVLAVNGLPIAPATYLADLEITSLGRVTNGDMVLFKAGNSVLLQPEFEVQLGGVFEVMMESCF